MKKNYLLLLFMFALLFLPFSASAQFTENRGQIMDASGNFHPEVLFSCQQGYDHLYFTKDRIVCVFSKPESFDFSPYAGNQRAIDSITASLGKYTQRIDIEFQGSDPDVQLVSGEARPDYVNYHLNGRECITGVRNFSSLKYLGIYPGVDMVFHQTETGIKYDIILHPGAKLQDIRIRYNGAERIEKQDDKLIIRTLYKDLEEHIPFSYFNGNTGLPARVKYHCEGDVISFVLADEQDYQTLTIDPVVTWMTFFETATMAGNMDYDHNISDSLGTLFIYGRCDNSANNYPLTNPGGSAYIQAATSNDAYIAKFNPNRALVWSTYFGGSTDLDWSLGTGVMAIKGNILHIVGDQMSSNGPYLNGGGFYYNAAATRPFWVRFNKSTGQMLHMTNISGHSSSHPSIAVSPSGQVGIIL